MRQKHSESNTEGAAFYLGGYTSLLERTLSEHFSTIPEPTITALQHATRPRQEEPNPTKEAIFDGRQLDS